VQVVDREAARRVDGDTSHRASNGALQLSRMAWAMQDTRGGLQTAPVRVYGTVRSRSFRWRADKLTNGWSALASHLPVRHSGRSPASLSPRAPPLQRGMWASRLNRCDDSDGTRYVTVHTTYTPPPSST
jgi:hypothetical protein